MNVLGKRNSEVASDRKVNSPRSSTRRRIGPSPLQANNPALSLENMASLAEQLDDRREFAENPLFLDEIDHEKNMAVINKSLYSDGFVQFSMLAEDFADQQDSAYIFNTSNQANQQQVYENILPNIDLEDRYKGKKKSPRAKLGGQETQDKLENLASKENKVVLESGSKIKDVGQAKSVPKDDTKSRIVLELGSSKKIAERPVIKPPVADEKPKNKLKMVDPELENKNKGNKQMNTRSKSPLAQKELQLPSVKVVSNKTQTAPKNDQKPLPIESKFPTSVPPARKQQDVEKLPARVTSTRDVTDLIIPKPKEIASMRQADSRSQARGQAKSSGVTPDAKAKKESKPSKKETKTFQEDDVFLPDSSHDHNHQKEAADMKPLFKQVAEDRKKSRTKSMSIGKIHGAILPERFRDIIFPEFVEDIGAYSKRKGRKTQADKIIENKVQENIIIGFSPAEFDKYSDYEILAAIKKRKHEVIKEQYNKGAHQFETRINTLLTSLVYKLQPLHDQHLCYCFKPTCQKAYSSVTAVYLGEREVAAHSQGSGHS